MSNQFQFPTLSSSLCPLLLSGRSHSHRLNRRTKYGCEGSALKIECHEGSAIRVIRANYGRFSIAICNDHGNTDWSVNCMSPRTLRVIKARWVALLLS